MPARVIDRVVMLLYAVTVVLFALSHSAVLPAPMQSPAKTSSTRTTGIVEPTRISDAADARCH